MSQEQAILLIKLFDMLSRPLTYSIQDFEEAKQKLAKSFNLCYACMNDLDDNSRDLNTRNACDVCGN